MSSDFGSVESFFREREREREKSATLNSLSTYLLYNRKWSSVRPSSSGIQLSGNEYPERRPTGVDEMVNMKRSLCFLLFEYAL